MSDTKAHFTNSKHQIIRPSLVLTLSPVASEVINNINRNFNRCVLDIDFTKGDSSGLLITVFSSNDNSVYRQQMNESVSTGTTTVVKNQYSYAGNAAEGLSLAFPIDHKYIKVYFAAIGNATGTLCACTAGLLNR